MLPVKLPSSSAKRQVTLHAEPDSQPGGKGLEWRPRTGRHRVGTWVGLQQGRPSMSDGRKRLSGAEYKKKAKMKKEEQEQVIRKTIKMDSFLTSGSKSSVVRPGTSTTCTDTTQSKKNETDSNSAVRQRLSPVEQSASKKTDNYDFDNEAVEESSISMSMTIEDPSPNPTSSTSNEQVLTTVNLNKDPALWEINDTLRRIIARSGFDQNKSCDLSKSEKIYGDRRRFLPVQIDEEIIYWRNVLKRVVAVVKRLCSRGLAFRGKNEKFGDPYNGNYSREEACKSLRDSWHAVIQTLKSIKDDCTEKPVTRQEAAGILSNLEKLETAVMVVVWNVFLERINKMSLQIQASTVDLITVADLYESLHRLVSELEKRQKAYHEFNEKFSFLTKMSELLPSTLTEKAISLEKMYPNDLKSDLVQECLHFQCHFSSERISIKPDSGSLKSLSLFLRKQNLEHIYPNLDIALRMALCTPVTNCSDSGLDLDSDSDLALHPDLALDLALAVDPDFVLGSNPGFTLDLIHIRLYQRKTYFWIENTSIAAKITLLCKLFCSPLDPTLVFLIFRFQNTTDVDRFIFTSIRIPDNALIRVKSTGLTCRGVEREAAATGSDDGSGALRPFALLLHRLGGAPLELLQETVYLRFYARRGARHGHHRYTQNKQTLRPLHISTLPPIGYSCVCFILRSHPEFIHYRAKFVHRPASGDIKGPRRTNETSAVGECDDMSLRTPPHAITRRVENKATPTDIYRSGREQLCHGVAGTRRCASFTDVRGRCGRREEAGRRRAHAVRAVGRRQTASLVSGGVSRNRVEVPIAHLQTD
ncbi:hypothetical protein EVAR_38552_1 [Eumeta japonica]|uniref:Uncharacterized protein n=1 Tax=Eumeta variegata TaxID=151549 RepID=A0A4C1WB23_EUMVA|nr:hypothetical protein EVAR_38552_1 [Eumeta japonica]